MHYLLETQWLHCDYKLGFRKNNMKKFKKIIFITLSFTFITLPTISLAATTPVISCSATVRNIGDILCNISSILNSIIPILLILGVIYFIWGVITYMIGTGEEAKKGGKNKIIYGLIGLVIIVGLWGIVNIVTNTFGIANQDLNFVNPANVIDNNLQAVNSANCFTNYQAGGNPKLGDLFNYVRCIIGASVIPLLFTLAVASFVWGVVQYVINDNEEAKKAKGRSFMIWGIIALTVMISIWGLVRILTGTFNIDFTVPQVHTQ